MSSVARDRRTPVKVGRILMLLAVPAYPLLVYGGLRVLTPRVLALALGAVFVLRETLQARQRPSPLLAPLVIVMAICAAAALFNDGRVFLLRAGADQRRAPALLRPHPGGAAVHG